LIALHDALRTAHGLKTLKLMFGVDIFYWAIIGDIGLARRFNIKNILLAAGKKCSTVKPGSIWKD
jgi:hypothetical protein